MPTSEKKTGILVSHTHWDRAWYLTYQQFRLRLVRLVDRLITLLDNNAEFASFTLDGQTVLLEDYLEIRPENRERLANLISSGRLHVGPWYTSPDLFLVSGESVIRNLQLGQSVARQFGSTMKVGYVPDPFGHFAQMPQILSKLGLDSFIFMRGLNENDKQNAGSIFNWSAPDGSKVMAIYLIGGYFNAGNLGYPDVYGRFEGLAPDKKLAYEQIGKSIALLEQYQKERVFLLNNGFDHMPEQPELPDLINDINNRGNGLVVQHGTFEDFVTAVQKENRPHAIVSGDLTGNADHPILQSVYSTRIYLKQQNHQAQSLLERYVEPLTAWAQQQLGLQETGSLLRHAWKQLLLNHPHDDICGCSVDGVHDDNEYRFRQVRELGNALLVEVLETIRKTGFARPGSRYSETETETETATGSGASDKNPAGTDLFVFNPHPLSCRQRVTARICFPATDEKSRPKTTGNDTSGVVHDGLETELPSTLKAFLPDGSAVPARVLHFRPHVMRNNYLESTWARCYDIELECDLPPVGYTILHITESEFPADQASVSVPDTTESTGNGLRLSMNGNRQYFLTDVAAGRKFANFIRFEYQQDAGDTYSFSPVRDAVPVWAAFTGCTAHPDHDDALRLSFSITVPAGLDTGEAVDTVTIPITCDLRLNPMSGLEIRVSYRNTAKNGRLRIVLPTGTTGQTALADAHFRYAPRSHAPCSTPESSPERYSAYPGELEYPTLHQNDFILFGEAPSVNWIANRGLHEFELLPENDQTYAAITLHRAVGYLSVGNGRIRRPHAGPAVPTPGAQCLRDLTADLCLGMGAGSTAQAAMLARSFSHPAWCREMPWLPHVNRTGDAPASHSILVIDNPAVVLSAIRRSDEKDEMVVRIFNPGSETETAAIRPGWPFDSWCDADLTETWVENNARKAVSGTINVNLGPFEIKTIVIR
jgi:mannosylglycerate hydrolase